MTLLLGYKNFVWIKLFKNVLHCLENRKRCSWAKWENILHRDLKLKSNNKFDSDDSDYASDDVNPLDGFKSNKKWSAFFGYEANSRFKKKKKRGRGRRGTRGRGGNNKQPQTTTTRSVWPSHSISRAKRFEKNSHVCYYCVGLFLAVFSNVNRFTNYNANTVVL